MIKIVFSLLFSIVLFASSYTIDLKKNSWNLVGSASLTSVDSLNLGVNDRLWQYKNGIWSLSKAGTVYPEVKNLSDGDAFWIYSTTERSIALKNSDTTEKGVPSGWSMFSPNKNINVQKSFNNANIGVVWYYNGKVWSAWDSKLLYKANGITELNYVKAGQGLWVYSFSPFNLDGSEVSFGTTATTLISGDFVKVQKKSTQTLEEIWNLSFKINPQDTSSFSVGVKFVKQSSGAFGELVFQDMSIINGVVTKPKYIYLKGTKSNGDSGGTYFYSGYNPNKTLENALSLEGDKLFLNLGTIMKNQTLIGINTFKAISNFTLQVNVNGLTLLNSKDISLGNLTTHNYGTTFDNQNGIEGIIEIY